MGEGFSADSLNPVTFFLHADWVVKGVMVTLAIASLWSWAVILDKFFRFGALSRAADTFEDAAASGRSLDDLAAQAGEAPQQPMPRLLVAALKEWRDTRGDARGRTPLTEGQVHLLIDRIDRTLDTLIARESRRIETGLGVLAVVATASPFIGLFGTVWGIMHAFGSIAAAKNTNLATVAPAISEALFATAMGLAAAIPAYIFYNKFSLDAGKLIGRMETFADELTTAVTRKLGERINDRAA
jgi:biopolymer transport protein TolQ